MREIKTRKGDVICTIDAETLREVNLYGANLGGANLGGANLDGANLCGANLHKADLRAADLRAADLRGATLCWANLRGANLEGANLRRADFSGANLRDTDLKEITMSWISHELVAEVLSRAAGRSASRRTIAGLVLVSQDWCWPDFLRFKHPQRQWALKVLALRIKPGDGAPEILHRLAERMARRKAEQ